jgi:branched-subunit amino acid aminotransferase/4-amino-4-deoxychorismate lyase
MSNGFNVRSLVYLNGRMVPVSEAHLPIYDAGVVLGATVSEQSRTFHHRPYKLKEHLDRLYGGLRYTGLDIGLSLEELAAISQDLVAHNAQDLHPEDELGLIQFVTAGELAAYADMAGQPPRTGPTVCVHTFPLPFERWARQLQTGGHLVTPSIRHVPPPCYNPHVKYRSRMHFFLADREARLVDPEASALLLDIHGNVTETGAANFFIVERGTLSSPTLANTLPGISRATLIELAGKLGIPFVERDIQLPPVLDADEALTTSTPYCLLPVTRINGSPIGTGKLGPVFRRLIDAWSQEVGLNIEKQILERAKRQQPSSSS